MMMNDCQGYFLLKLGLIGYLTNKAQFSMLRNIRYRLKYNLLIISYIQLLYL